MDAPWKGRRFRLCTKHPSFCRIPCWSFSGGVMIDDIIVCILYTIRETNSLHLKMGVLLKRKLCSLPTIHFQVRAVSFREGMYIYIYISLSQVYFSNAGISLHKSHWFPTTNASTYPNGPPYFERFDLIKWCRSNLPKKK